MFFKIYFLLFVLFFVVSSTSATLVFAAEIVSAGITPDSPVYFLDTLTERIGLAFAFKPATKITKAKDYAAEKSAELALMLQENKAGAQIKANQRYLGMIKTVMNKMVEATEKDSEFKNRFVPQMISVINNYNAILKTQSPEKIKGLREITKEANDLFVKTYEAPQQDFVSLRLTPQVARKKLCEMAAARPIKDEITKVFEMLCGQEFAVITAADKEKQEAVYKAIFDAASRDDISDTTKSLVHQIALADLSFVEASQAIMSADETIQDQEFKVTKSRQVACDFSCNSYNCPAGQKAEEKFEHQSRRIFDPWDWGGASLIDRLLLSLKITDTPPPAPVLSFAISEDSCIDSDKRFWHGSGIINQESIAQKYTFNEETFLNNFQAAFEEARRNCPASGDDSYTFTLMCLAHDFADGKRYSEQYGTINDKCSASEAEAAQIKKTNIHNETWTYMASQYEAKSAEGIERVEMAITPSGETLPVEFDALTKEIKVSGSLPAGDYNYEMKFILKDGKSVSPEGSGGHFTIQPCSQSVFNCAKVSSKIILDRTYSGQGVCRGYNSDKLFLDQFGCVKEDYNEQFEDVPDYTEQLEDIYINVKYAGFCHYSLLDEAREQYNDAIKHRAYSEADALWADDDELATEKIDIGDEATLFWLLDPMLASDIDYIDTDHRGLIVARVGKCHIWAVGNTEVNHDIWNKYHYANLDKLVAEGIITSVNEHPNFDHGKQYLKDLLVGFAREVHSNIREQCGD